MYRTRIVLFLFWIAIATLKANDAPAQLIERIGRHIQLTTDLPSAEADQLVASFDAAANQWVRFWNLDEDSIGNWKVTAFVMRNKSAFAAQGLIPDHIPDFPFGYAHGDSVWVLAQESEYYTRHLLLHEGVHSLAFSQFGGAGPTWFMEGSAELLATHRGIGKDVQTNAIPADRESVPFWGRFKRMSQVRQEDKVPALSVVMRYQPTLTGDVATYSWSWAATMLFHAYPEYRPAFYAAAKDGSSGPRFNRRLFAGITQKRWPVVLARWRVMCHDLDYGFDWSRERLAISETDPLWDGQPLKLRVEADRGWQSVGVRFAPGMALTIRPDGQIQLDTDPRPWISEPSGVTIRYYRGRPIGQLMACVLPNAAGQDSTIRPLRIRPIETETTFRFDRHSWLLLRVNDDIGDLENNSGAYDVEVMR